MIAPVRLAATFLFATMLRADEAPAVDDDLPQPFDPDLAGTLMSQSPFTRVVNLEETLQLTGLAYVEGKPVATFFNKITQQHVTVSEQPNALGWKIIEAIPGLHLEDTEVHLMIGTEEITVHYGDAQLSPGASKKGMPGALIAGAGSNRNYTASSKDGNFPKTSSFLGENGRELYVSLSSDSRDKLKSAVREYLEKHPGQSPEKTTTYAQKIYSKLKASEQKAPSGAKSPKSERPRKQG
jgi:hypothetical protein